MPCFSDSMDADDLGGSELLMITMLHKPAWLGRYRLKPFMISVTTIISTRNEAVNDAEGDKITDRMWCVERIGAGDAEGAGRQSEGKSECQGRCRNLCIILLYAY